MILTSKKIIPSIAAKRLKAIYPDIGFVGRGNLIDGDKKIYFPGEQIPAVENNYVQLEGEGIDPAQVQAMLDAYDGDEAIAEEEDFKHDVAANAPKALKAIVLSLLDLLRENGVNESNSAFLQRVKNKHKEM